MAILAEGGITLTSVNDACSVLLSPSSCVIHADYDGSNPILNTAFTDINVIRGNVKLPITPSNISVIAKSDSEIVCAFQTVNFFTQRLFITYLPSTILNGSIQIQVTYDSLIMTPTFVFSVERESTMLAWIQDWETRKTQIGSEYIITPKFFAGKKEADNSLTGVYVGPDANGAGIYGYQAGKEIFHLNEIGGSIGGWNIQNGGISTSDGKLRILSEGSIISLNSDDEVIYGLYKTGEATFAKGNVLFHADGSASFKGSITAEGGSIAGWNIASRAIWKNHILLDSLTNYIGLGPAEITNANLADNTYSHRNIVQTSGGISMFYTSANAYGIEGYLPAVYGETKLVFKLGDVNKIAGWTFDVNSLVSNYVTLTNQTNNAGVYFSADDISEVASSGLSAHINAGTGAYIKAGSGVVELAGVVDGATVFKMGTGGNQIAGWSFSNTAIWTGNATVQDGFTTTANSMVLTGTGIYGYKWGLNADGSGKLAGGRIAWTVNGDSCSVNIGNILIVDDNVSNIGVLLSKTIMARNSEGVIKAGMSAEGALEDSVRFWAGSSFEDRASADFRVLQDGNCYAYKFHAKSAEIVNGDETHRRFVSFLDNGIEAYSDNNLDLIISNCEGEELSSVAEDRAYNIPTTVNGKSFNKSLESAIEVIPERYQDEEWEYYWDNAVFLTLPLGYFGARSVITFSQSVLLDWVYPFILPIEDGLGEYNTSNLYSVDWEINKLQIRLLRNGKYFATLGSDTNIFEGSSQLKGGGSQPSTTFNLSLPNNEITVSEGGIFSIEVIAERLRLFVNPHDMDHMLSGNDLSLIRPVNGASYPAEDADWVFDDYFTMNMTNFSYKRAVSDGENKFMGTAIFKNGVLHKNSYGYLIFTDNGFEISFSGFKFKITGAGIMYSNNSGTNWKTLT
ncbi:MAG: hypothetical protein PUB73_05920 [Bacteroidales bacterium]|nr:hypothetical protein [Bacteroidales bacterium]